MWLPWTNSVTLTYIAAERTWTYSKHISRDRYPASVLARRSDLQKTELPLLLHVGPCLQSCSLATRWSNPLQYIGPDITGARGSVVGRGAMLQIGRSRVRFPMRSLDFFNWSNPSSRTMALGSTQLLTEMSTRNLPGRKGRAAGA
jgi:hypothetical protein